MKRLLLLLAFASTALAFTGQPATCLGCLQFCGRSGSYCGPDCTCLCRQYQCECFALYRVQAALEAGWR